MLEAMAGRGILLLFLSLCHRFLVNSADGLCRTQCGSVAVQYPFGIDDGCGAPQYRTMFSCDGDLEFHTPSGTYEVQSIDYEKEKVTIFDPGMSTCVTLQAPKDFAMDEVQSVLIPPSPGTVFILLNCSANSPLLNRYSSLCGNFSGNGCDEMYSCPSFRMLRGMPCCSTDYKSIKFLGMNATRCSHYATIYNAETLHSMNPMDWPYGIQLSYTLPDSVCDRCQRTGGTCGFDTETERVLCLCNGMNSTRDCGHLSESHSLHSEEFKLLSVLSFMLSGIMAWSLGPLS